MLDNHPGVPLSHYREHPGCGVRFCCQACAVNFDAPLEAVIHKLQLRGLGGAETGVRAVARTSVRLCCKSSATQDEPGLASCVRVPTAQRSRNLLGV